MQSSYILAIETTCDETSVAVLKNGKELLSNVIYTQIDLHKKYAGVVPELASRAHAAKVASVVSTALKEKQITPTTIAFANGPGLPGGLLVGRVAAETLGALYNVPVMGVNHLEGHLYAAEFDGNLVTKPLKFPLISLIVSGGHTELWKVSGYGKYKLLGKTRDDAAGEAFDKVAKLLKLPYPGGPQVSALALKGKLGAIKFPRPFMKGNFEFSFSGIKTAVSYYLRDHKDYNPADVCLAFEEAVTDTLVYKTLSAAQKYDIKNIVIGGGVCANKKLQNKMLEEGKKLGYEVRFAGKGLTSDNAAMLALCAFHKLNYAKINKSIRINPNMPLRSWISK